MKITKPIIGLHFSSNPFKSGKQIRCTIKLFNFHYRFFLNKTS